MTERSCALIDNGFAELGVRCVFASTYEENIAARWVMEKAGMTFARAFLMTSQELAVHGAAPNNWAGDDVEYALARAEYERQRVAGATCAAHTSLDGE